MESTFENMYENKQAYSIYIVSISGSRPRCRLLCLLGMFEKSKFRSSLDSVSVYTSLVRFFFIPTRRRLDDIELYT